MATLKQLLTVLTITTVCITPIFAQGQQAQNNCDPNCLQLQDGSCDQCPNDGTCDGTGSHRRGGQGRRGGHGNGKGNAMGYGQNCGLSCTVDPLTEVEIPLVIQMRQEEKMARDVYQTLNETWTSDVVARIAASEQRHMDAIAKVIATQDMNDPITDDTVGVYPDANFVDLYNSLTEQGSASYIEALKVGAYIEELDIMDLEASLTDVTNEQLIRVFTNLLRGSRNHLRAFVSALALEGETYSPQIMSQEDYDSIINAGVERGNGRMGRGRASSN